MSEVVVIGGGAAGMMAAVKAAEALGDGSRVLLLERGDRLGRKIYLTGKGRCNITNMRPWSEFAPHIHPNAQFFKHAFHAFSNVAVQEFFESCGLETSVEQGMRLFPLSMRAADVVRALERRVSELGVRVSPSSRIEHFSDVREFLERGCAVILATGGCSYPVTGSTGDGYAIAAEAGHKISRTFPSLTALKPVRYDTSLVGVDLKNVALRLYIDRDCVQEELGEMSFTGDGIEGALGYRVSRRAVWALENGQKVELSLDLKPGLELPKLAARIARDVVSASGAPRMGSILRGLMPAGLVGPFMAANPGLSFENLAERLKDWRFRIASYKGYERAVVTAGGVSLNEVVSKTMESRLVPGLYFAGEVLDLDGDTGGYNLQIAFSTGALAGLSAAKKDNKK